MWGSTRWTARFLLLFMVASAFAPAALAQCIQPTHCQRQPPGQAAMPCHHAMDHGAGNAAATKTFLAAGNDCCGQHCCCGATTSEWAQPASILLSAVELAAGPRVATEILALRSSGPSSPDSARAPPLG